MVTLTSENIAYATAQNFLELMKNNVSSVSVTNPKTNESESHSIKFYHTKYNDQKLNSKSHYPCLIVELPNTPEDLFTFRKKQVAGTIDIQVHCTNSIVTAKFHDLIKKTIEDNEDWLKERGISKVVKSADEEDTVQRNGFKDHWALSSYSFEFEFDYGN